MSASLKARGVHWSDDEAEFYDHFDVEYPAFCAALAALDHEHQAKYEAIRHVSPEAAILWAIHEAKESGILVEE